MDDRLQDALNRLDDELETLRLLLEEHPSCRDDDSVIRAVELSGDELAKAKYVIKPELYDEPDDDEE